MNAARLGIIGFVLGSPLAEPTLADGSLPRTARANVCGLGVLAPSGKVLFLPGAGSVDAVALYNGKTLWQSKTAAAPLLATDRQVFAQAPVKGKRSQVLVVVLDARTGEHLLSSKTIAFPEWVSVQPDYGVRFRSSARLAKDGLLLLWEAWAFSDGGEPPADPDPNKKHASGAVRVDPVTGAVAAVKGYQLKEEDFPPENGDARAARAGGWVFHVNERWPEPGFPYSMSRRTLKAESADRQRRWEHPIAGQPFLPPRP
jgi:hypothetical protein